MKIRKDGSILKGNPGLILALVIIFVLCIAVVCLTILLISTQMRPAIGTSKAAT